MVIQVNVFLFDYGIWYLTVLSLFFSLYVEIRSILVNLMWLRVFFHFLNSNLYNQKLRKE